jgi:hypothetical protein
MSAIHRIKDQPCDLEYIRLRCRQDDDCWLWMGHKKHGTLPTVWFRRPDLSGAIKDFELHVRQLVVWLKKGKRPRGFLHEVYRPSCGHDDCVNPAHMKRHTKSEMASRPATVLQRANIAKARRKQSKIPDEVVQEIKEADGPGRDIAEKYGISQQYVSMIKRGLYRREYTANPFAGLL